MQRPVTDAKQPDIDRAGLLGPKALRGVAQLVGGGSAPGVHVDGDVLAVVVGFDRGANVALVDLVAETGGLLCRAAGRHDGFLPAEQAGRRRPQMQERACDAPALSAVSNEVPQAQLLAALGFVMLKPCFMMSST